MTDYLSDRLNLIVERGYRPKILSKEIFNGDEIYRRNFFIVSEKVFRDVNTDYNSSYVPNNPHLNSRSPRIKSATLTKCYR